MENKIIMSNKEVNMQEEVLDEIIPEPPVTHDDEKNALRTERLDCESRLRVVESEILRVAAEKGDTVGLLRERLSLKSRIYDIGVEINRFDGIEPTDGEKLAIAKERMVAEIDIYDKSTSVNELFVNGISFWLSSEERDKLKKRLETDKQSGLEVTKVFHKVFGTQPLVLPIEQTEQMLFQLEQYARDCFDKTNEHKADVVTLDTVEEVEAYDYTDGYPEKLSFTIAL